MTTDSNKTNIRGPRIGLVTVHSHETGLPNPSRETKFSGANANREIFNANRKIFIFSVLLTTCRTDNLTRLIHTLAICDDDTCMRLRYFN